MSVINKKIFFVEKKLLLKKRAPGLVYSFIDLSTRRNIEQTSKYGIMNMNTKTVFYILSSLVFPFHVNL
jgi:hypothetical protein